MKPKNQDREIGKLIDSIVELDNLKNSLKKKTAPKNEERLLSLKIRARIMIDEIDKIMGES